MHGWWCLSWSLNHTQWSGFFAPHWHQAPSEHLPSIQRNRPSAFELEGTGVDFQYHHQRCESTSQLPTCKASCLRFLHNRQGQDLQELESIQTRKVEEQQRLWYPKRFWGCNVLINTSLMNFTLFLQGGCPWMRRGQCEMIDICLERHMSQLAQGKRVGIGMQSWCRRCNNYRK